MKHIDASLLVGASTKGHIDIDQERVEEVQSSALLPLPGVGLIAVGSRDANRFYPGMGTLFLRMMGESLVVALQRFPSP